MPELAVTDGMPPPADLPHGEFWATSLADDTIRIDRADPRLMISAELLDAICAAPQNAVLDTRTRPAPAPVTAAAGIYTGAIVKLYGVNRTVIYCIGEYVPRVNGYIAEWPD